MIKNRFRGWTLDRKIYVVVACLIYAISVIMLAVCSYFYTSSYIEQSRSIARDQLSAVTGSYASALNSYKNLAESLTIDDSIQAYLKTKGPSDPTYFERVTGVKSTLQSAQNLYADLMFVAVVSYRFDDIAYKGTISKISSGFARAYAADYENSRFSGDSGTLRMSYNDAYLKGKRLLNVYFPVYSISNMIRENGLLCMVFGGSPFDALVSKKDAIRYDSSLILVDSAGAIASCADESLIGTPFGAAQRFEGPSGSFHDRSQLYNYQKIGKWSYYLVSQIPLNAMYRDCALMMLLLAAICVAVALVGQVVCRRIIRRTYQPLGKVIQAMNLAADGHLEQRVALADWGADFSILAADFNHMMEQINQLMEQVKLDQKVADQLRFNALQSQIQPHFLYNALDSIHWQASADGNQEISEFVKALAQYYRLCLSKGRDVIELSQELEHVRNYLIIQNIRYDQIIEGIIDMDEECRSVPIPKITLQPLVENSIYHGIKVKEGRHGVLRIEACRSGKDVLIRVSDDGTGMTDEQIRTINESISEYQTDFGYGVRNVNKRIELLFGKEYGLHYEKNPAGGVTVTIRLPAGEGVSHV